jgi:hypothetical protein
MGKQRQKQIRAQEIQTNEERATLSISATQTDAIFAKPSDDQEDT